MAEDLQYRLTADSTNMERGFKSAEASATAFERELAKLERQQAKVDRAMDQVDRGMLIGGAAIGAGLLLATKAAIDWESAWTGVAKVVDGSPAQLAALEAGLRDLTHTLPQTHEEIAGVAAAAGQLGVATPDIIDFTRVMVNLGVATNLSSQDAAFALARLMNIMQTAPKDVGRLGAAITELGNNSATTEADIVAMALRIAGAGNIIGLTEADVLGFAAALSSVGVEAEAGGSAISRAFIKIESAVRAGGDQLDTFAEVAGMSADEFRAAYERDAAQAITSFIAGLGRINESGGDVFATLEDLGMTEIRLRDALLRLSGAGDVLSRSIDTGNKGWDQNTALLKEAERRYGTVEARMQIARNAVNDFAIDLGNTFLPVVGEAADLAAAFAGVVGDLPGPLKAALAILAALTAGLLLVGGTLLIGVPRVAAYRQAMETLVNTTGRLAAVTVATSGVMGKVGSFLTGPWGIALGAAAAAVAAFGMAQAKTRQQVADLADTLDEQTGAITENTRLKVLNSLETSGMAEEAQRLGISMSTLIDAALGDADALDKVARATAGARAEQEALSGENVFVRVNDLSSALREQSGVLAAAQQRWRRQKEATDGAKTSVDQLNPSTRRLAEGLGITAEQAQDVTDQLSELDKELKAVFDSVFGLRNAQDDLLDAIDRLKDGIDQQRDANDKNAGSFRGSSKAARENRDNMQAVLEAQAAVTLETIRHSGSQAEAQKAAANFKAEMQRLAKQLGINLDKVDGYNEVVDEIERVVTTKFTADTRSAQRKVQTYQQWLNSIPAVVRTRVEAEVRRVGGGVREFSHGGMVHGPGGVDRVPAHLTVGEFVSTTAATRANRAALEAANAGARLAVVGSPAAGGSGGGGVTVENLNLTAYSDTFSIKQVMDDLAWHGVH